MARLGEDELIARYFGPIAGPGALALMDDAALISPAPDHDLVLTADALVAGVHFFPEDAPASIARKALGVNLSDLAAKGADPTGYLLTLALPDGWTEAWIREFTEGLDATGQAAGCVLLGGDTVRAAGPLTLSITALGTVPSGLMVRRTTARPGDVLCVTGTIGDAHLGLALASGLRPEWAEALTASEVAFLVDRYRHPQARSTLAAALRENASAAMDVSDGFAGDVGKMLRASGVGGTVELGHVPLSAAASAAVQARPELRDALVSGGDDYEILCSVPSDRVPALLQAGIETGITVTPVGTVSAAPGLAFTRAGHAHDLPRLSFAHF